MFRLVSIARYLSISINNALFGVETNIFGSTLFRLVTDLFSYIDDQGCSQDLTIREELCEEWRKRSHTNEGIQLVIKINGYTIKKSNYDIVFSLGNKCQHLRPFTPVKKLLP